MGKYDAYRERVQRAYPKNPQTEQKSYSGIEKLYSIKRMTLRIEVENLTAQLKKEQLNYDMAMKIIESHMGVPFICPDETMSKINELTMALDEKTSEIEKVNSNMEIYESVRKELSK